MAFWTYIIHCSDGSYYTGHTDDLEKQIGQHHSGTLQDCYTASRRPLELVWANEYQTRYDALANERRIKNWSRAKKEALIASDWRSLSYLAIPPGERAQRASASLGSDARPRPELSRDCARDERRSGADETVRSERSRGIVPSEVEGRSAKRSPSQVGATPNLAIVLVRPQLGENIGKAARAMLNFGLTELRLVAPRDGWPNPSAGPAAAGADLVLAQATVHATLADAVADCSEVYATTVRKRGVTKPVLTPEAAAGAIHAARGQAALVFGPERSGLETEEVALARAIVTVPVNPTFASLNLAQAVILCAYEWSKTQALAQPTAEELLPPAPQAELDGMIAQFEALLEPKGYFLPPSRAAATRRTLRTMLTKPGWNHLEVRTLRGVLSTLARRDER